MLSQLVQLRKGQGKGTEGKREMKGKEKGSKMEGK